jgi:hypothetical protein
LVVIVCFYCKSLPPRAAQAAILLDFALNYVRAADQFDAAAAGLN